MALAAASLIGRDEDLTRLYEFLESENGTTIVLVLEGEPGIGKTTLWRAGIDRARELGFRVMEARPAASERQLSFAVLGDLLADVKDEISALPAPQRRALRIALVLDEAAGEPPEQRTIAVAVTELLRRMAADSRLMLALDDAQWIDAPSAAALAFAMRRLDEPSVRVLATTRTNEASAFVPEGSERRSVGPLSLDALDRLSRQRLGARFLRPALQRLHDVSGGNPFYALGLAAGLLRSGYRLQPGEPLPIPTHLREVVRARLATITPSAREAALAAAALAQPNVATVQAAVGNGSAAIAEAVSAGVLETDGELLHFAHPLFAAGVYDDSAPADRRAMHSCLAKVVSDPEERARHLAESAEGPSAKVAGVVEAAAANVAARGAADAAARLAKLAVDLTPPDQRDALHKRRLDCARYSFVAGDPQHAEALLEQQLEATMPGRERAEVEFELGNVRHDREGVDASRACYERALAELEERDELELETRIVLKLTGTELAAPDRDSDTRSSARALALAERLAKPGLLARALGLHGLKLTLQGRPPPDEYWQRAFELEAESDELRIDGPTSLYSWASFINGNFADTSDQQARLIDSMRHRGDPMLPHALLGMSEDARVSGDWAAAARYAAEAHDFVVQTGKDALEPQCLVWKARAALPRGDIDAARTHAEEALALLVRVSSAEGVRIRAFAHSILGQAAEMEGTHAEAHRSFTVAIDTAEVSGKPMQHMLGELIAGDVECLLALGDREGASEQLHRLRRMSAELDYSTFNALLERARGLVAAADGDLAAAERHLLRAVERFKALEQPWPFQVGRALFALGTVQRRARRKLPARKTLERALEIFVRLGAHLWAERTRGELAQISGRPTRSGALTETERRVADLVAAGRSNAEVAHELFMSPKTVEWNLSKIYKKLHVRSRSELAAKLAKQTISA